MNKHWTARNIEDFRFRITADFIAQLEDKMESIPLSPKELADKLGITKGRVSQIFNDPGNISLKKIIEYSKALNMKVALMAYEDNDPENTKGPINSEIFRICWEKCGKPRDFWALNETYNGTTTEVQRTRALKLDLNNIHSEAISTQLTVAEKKHLTAECR